MSKIIDGIAKDLKAIPETLKAKTADVYKKKLILMNYNVPKSVDTLRRDFPKVNCR